jgi:ketosteroid isomerase-like protein
LEASHGVWGTGTDHFPEQAKSALQTVQFRTDKSASIIIYPMRWPSRWGLRPIAFTKSQKLRTAMKKTFMWCLSGLLLLGSAASLQAQQTGNTEKAVGALEQQWLQSQKTNNPDLVAPLLADKFVNTSTDGKVTGRTEMLATAKATKYDSVDYDDLKVTVFGDAAIATGTFKAKGTDSSGKPMDVKERFTDTWIKMANGKWQCVASQGSQIKT